jgi:hypothetical protein
MKAKELISGGAVPLLEGKHRSPVEPEVRIEEILAENFIDSLLVELFGSARINSTISFRAFEVSKKSIPVLAS